MIFIADVLSMFQWQPLRVNLGADAAAGTQQPDRVVFVEDLRASLRHISALGLPDKQSKNLYGRYVFVVAVSNKGPLVHFFIAFRLVVRSLQGLGLLFPFAQVNHLYSK